MNEHPSYRVLRDYVLDLLEDTEREAADHHVESCSHCRERLSALRSVEQRIRDGLNPSLGRGQSRLRFADVRDRVWRRRRLNRARLTMGRAVGYAAGSLVLLGLATTSVAILLLSPDAAAPPTPDESGSPVYHYPTSAPQVIRWQVESGDVEEAETFAAVYNLSQPAVEMVVQSEVGGESPDIVGPWDGLLLDRVAEQWLDLEDVSPGNDLTVFEPGALAAWRIDGRLIGFPVAEYPAVIVYNTDLFDAAGLAHPPHEHGEAYADGVPWSFDKLAEVAMRLTVDAEGRDAADPQFDPTEIQRWGLANALSTPNQLLVFGAGDPIAEWPPVLPEPWREAIRWNYAGMWEMRFLTNGESDSALDAFGRGSVAMVYADLSFACQVAEERGVAWDIALPPAGYHGKGSLESTGAVGVPATTSNPWNATLVAYEVAARLPVYSCAVPANRERHESWCETMSARYPGVDWNVGVESLRQTEFVVNTSEYKDLLNTAVVSLLADPTADMEGEIEDLGRDLSNRLDPKEY